MHSFILQTINGISYAALLFLLASGFTLTFGLMRIVNMAHGGLYLFGGYVGLTVAKAHQVFNALGFELEFSLRKVVKTPAAAHGPAKKAAKRA